MSSGSLQNLRYLIIDLKRVWAPKQPFAFAFLFSPLLFITVWSVVSYRLGRSMWLLPTPFRQILAPVRFVQKRFFQLFTGTDISEKADIGPGFFIAHNGPVVIGRDIKTGKNFFVRQGVTVGGDGRIKGHAIFGDNVMMGANAVVLGNVTIGSDVIIGANAVVTKDVPADSVVAGIPARVLEGKSGYWADRLGSYDE